MRRALTVVSSLVVAMFAAFVFAACSSAAPAPPSGAASIVVITDSVGDQIAADLERILGRSVDRDAVPESGYLSASPAAVADRVTDAPTSTTVFVLALGAADVNSAAPADIRDAAIAQALAAASARAGQVVVLAPLVPTGSESSEWRAALRDAAVQFGAVYLDVDVPAAAWDQSRLTTAAATDIATRLANVIDP